MSSRSEGLNRLSAWLGRRPGPEAARTRRCCELSCLGGAPGSGAPPSSGGAPPPKPAAGSCSPLALDRQASGDLPPLLLAAAATVAPRAGGRGLPLPARRLHAEPERSCMASEGLWLALGAAGTAQRAPGDHRGRSGARTEGGEGRGAWRCVGSLLGAYGACGAPAGHPLPPRPLLGAARAPRRRCRRAPRHARAPGRPAGALAAAPPQQVARALRRRPPRQSRYYSGPGPAETAATAGAAPGSARRRPRPGRGKGGSSQRSARRRRARRRPHAGMLCRRGAHGGAGRAPVIRGRVGFFTPRCRPPCPSTPRQSWR
jgi:hypothetical protein